MMADKEDLTDLDESLLTRIAKKLKFIYYP